MVADAGQLAVDVRSKLPEVQQAGAQQYSDHQLWPTRISGYEGRGGHQSGHYRRQSS
ncbi:hypothetical protein KIH21_04390 [Lacticaseibacillus paracasei subsp. paracasei]|nr:hypothetical protein KIH21_04390 [Lacticaseibacillus paracasei subsp. paracasei]